MTPAVRCDPVPELPEVETTRRGLEPLLLGKTVAHVDIRERRLRWPVPRELAAELAGQRIRTVTRRAKYLLLGTDRGSVIVHLGMSGSLRAVTDGSPPGEHDHVQWRFNGGLCVRLRDPRRFGAVLWTAENPLAHPLLAHLGPEPLSAALDGEHLHRRSRKRRASAKAFIMDSRVVAGLGNIYASEALFLSGIHPARVAGRIALPRYQALATAIKSVLSEAIRAGGTTLRDFLDGTGNPGYFGQQLRVYGRQGRACDRCGGPLRQRAIAQRSTVYCQRCQR